MQIRTINRCGSVSAIMLILSFLWVREISMRVACDAASDFIGPLVREVPCHYVYFSFNGFTMPKGRIIAPGWTVNFHPYGVELDPGVEVYVSIRGKIIACNLPELNALVSALPELREKQINLFRERRAEGQSIKQ